MTGTATVRRGGALPRTGASGMRERRRFVVRGVVQGVGFRPFAWTLARDHGLAGFVRNTSGGVIIEAEGDPGGLDAFDTALRTRPPRLARIDSIEVAAMAPSGETGFAIETSRAVAGEYQPISPDAATCAACVAELFDPGDRRHRHPFINCTDCGPRFTIIEDVPYDRPLTTMRAFAMCSRCRDEYTDPGDRRFHAQPIACPDCGPRLWLATPEGVAVDGDPIRLAAAALRRGEIVALKGLGGFQIACAAGHAGAVARMRERKRRPAKPFAVMVGDLAAARALCNVDDVEAALLEGTVRPVVLLRVRAGAAAVVAPGVAPGLRELGLMLPTTPLHHLLLEAAGGPLVMTSGNVSEEPIAAENADALRRLGAIADLFLLHDRAIHARYDDSVVRVVAGEARMVRRARGYCPAPLPVSGDGQQVLAMGAHLKNTFCVLRDGRAFVGPHVGDLDTPQALRHHDEALTTYLRLFRAAPSVVACDLHPDYASTGLAERWWEGGAVPVRVQHHHAHIASVMAEHGLRGRVLGVAFDGVGYGPDGTLWGGEFLVCDERSYRRAGHLAPVRQPGGDRAAREGWRMAAAYLEAAGRASEALPDVLGGAGAPDARRWRLVARVAAGGTAPVTTSAGRLFDAAASLLGVAQASTFEGEAAMRLEAVAASAGGVAGVDVAIAGEPAVLDTPALVAHLVDERRRGRPVPELAAVFHESLAQAVAATCHRLATAAAVRRVALSGGVFQNALLLQRCTVLLGERDLEVFTNRAVPANDGGISLGQALVAAAVAAEGEP